MSRHAATTIRWSIVTLTVALSAVGLALTVAGGATGESGPLVMSTVALTASTCAVVGALIARREPSNPIGWLFLGFAAYAGPGILLNGYAEVVDATRGAGRWAAWVGLWAPTALVPLTIFVLLLFPDGRLLSPRWRPVAWCAVVGTTVALVGIAGNPGSLGGDFSRATNPTAIDSALARGLRLGGLTLAILAFLAAVASIVLRYRSADELRRQQIKLLAAAAATTALCNMAGEIARDLHAPVVRDLLSVVGVLAIPVSIAVAMLRYRLYDVDRLISRSLTYMSVTAILGAAYAGLVLEGQELFSSIAGGSNLAIAVSTLVVAAMFLPLRSRVQRLVNRRFYRRSYDAQRTLESFGARLRQEIELESLTDDLRRVIGETMQPTHVSVWLRKARH